MSKKLKELRKINNDLDTKISKENQPLFTDMICYIRSANISVLTQEKVRRDLSEIVISAQSRGEKISDVISGDLKTFCDEIIANLETRTVKEKWIERLDLFCLCMPILGTISLLSSSDFSKLINNMLSKQPINYDISVSIGMVISMLVIMTSAVLIVDRITKTALNAESNATKPKRFLLGSIIGAIIMSLFISLWKFGSHVLFNINIFLAIAILVGCFIVHKTLDRI